MGYSVAAAKKFIGKRVVVSLRHIDEDGNQTYSGFWGVIESAQEDGLLLRVEGGLNESYWGMPPHLDALQPAQHDYYQLGETGEIVTDIDFEAYWTSAPSLELLEQRDAL
jgi:hypothetical protein